VHLGWEAWSAAGPWLSNAQLTPNTLTVRYGIMMMPTDFEDATYRLVE